MNGSELTREEVTAMEAALAQHYGEPVQPVSRYCKGFHDYERAIAARVNELEQEQEQLIIAGEDLGSWYDAHNLRHFTEVREALRLIGSTAAKSNLLHRLIYLGEPLRSEKCPEHRGRWSGCDFQGGCPHDCLSGLNITGWLRPSDEAIAEHHYQSAGDGSDTS